MDEIEERPDRPAQRDSEAGRIARLEEALRLERERLLAERRRAEAALRQSEQRFHRLAERARDMIYRMSLPDGRYEYVSPASADLLGYAPDELYANPGLLQQTVHPDWQAYLAEEWRRLLAGDAPPTYEYQVVHRSKGVRWLNQRNILIRDEAGNPVAIEGIVTDVTDRKEAEQALARSEETLRTMLRAAPVGLSIIKDRLMRVTNDHFCEIVGYSAQELEGRSTRLFFDTDAEYERVGRTLYDGLWEAGIRHAETTHRRRDGQLRHVALTAAPLDPRDPQAGVAVATQDITDRKRAEEEGSRLQERLLQAQKMESVGRLAGGIAHDFNNMLGVILGNAELGLMQTSPTDSLHPLLTEIQSAAQRSANLTRQLLAFARRQTIDPKVLDLNDTVAGMLKMLQRLIGEDIDLVWKPGANLWSVRMDPSQIDQVLANLCVNSRDAIPGVGRVVIETSNVAADRSLVPADERPGSAGEHVLLSVSDNGCGMDQDTQAHIFEPFFTTKGTGHGTGLGLATVYGIVEQNGGSISVHSEPGMGTTFRIFLPRHTDQATADALEAAPLASARAGETILLVEDEAGLLRLSQQMLERLGYRVLSTSSTGEALRLTRESPGKIDLLVTDVVMPGMNGHDLARQIAPFRPGLRVLFMSGYTSDVVLDHGVPEEGAHFLQKPFTIAVLAAKVREALGD